MASTTRPGPRPAIENTPPMSCSSQVSRISSVSSGLRDPGSGKCFSSFSSDGRPDHRWRMHSRRPARHFSPSPMPSRIISQRNSFRPAHAPSERASSAANSSSVAASVLFPADRSRRSASANASPSPIPISSRASQNSSIFPASPPATKASHSANQGVSLTVGNDSSCLPSPRGPCTAGAECVAEFVAPLRGSRGGPCHEATPHDPRARPGSRRRGRAVARRRRDVAPEPASRDRAHDEGDGPAARPERHLGPEDRHRPGLRHALARRLLVLVRLPRGTDHHQPPLRLRSAPDELHP